MRTIKRYITPHCRQVNYSITRPNTSTMPVVWQTISLQDINGMTISRLFIDLDDMTYDINAIGRENITLPL